MICLFQGDRQIVEVLEFIVNEVGVKKGRKSQKQTKKIKLSSIDFPIIEKIGISGDVEDYVTSVNNESPKLYLFFDSGGKFDVAEVAADKSILHLQANDVIYALVLFIAVYFVFHVGYPRNQSHFLGFLQVALLQIPYDGHKSKGYTELIEKFDGEMEKLTEAKQFKKLCV